MVPIAGLLLSLLVPCVHGAVAFTQGPALIPNPSGRVPLAAVIEFATPEKLEARVDLSDGKNQWAAAFGYDVSKNGRYAIPLLGMRPDREHRIKLTLSADGEDRYVREFVYSTPPITINPLEFPPIDVQIAEPERMEPGILFLSIRRRIPGRGHWLSRKQLRFATHWGMLVAIDASGEVIWWYESDSRTAGIDRLNNGNLMMHRANFSTLEIDLLGNVVGEYYAEKRPLPPPSNPRAIPLKGIQTLHHQPHQMPNGDYLAFAANGYLIEDYHSSDVDPDAPREDAMVMADTVVQFNAQGEQVWTWNTMDYLDPFRIGKNTFWSYWWTRGFPDHRDWTHANGLSYDPSDDSILVSLRNQSAVLKIDRKTKRIKWILGNHKGWPEHLRAKLLTPVGDLIWPGYQHNPRMTHAGTVILFDNRAHGGVMAFEEPLAPHLNFSRGVEYAVDEAAMTVEQIWSSGDAQTPDSCYTHAMSDAWRMPVTDNRLVIHAFCVPRVEGLTEDIMDHSKRVPVDFPMGGRILEFDGAEVVFRAEVKDPQEVIQWEVYGGFKSPGLYHTPRPIH